MGERKRTRSQMPKALWVGYSRGEYHTYTGQEVDRCVPRHGVGTLFRYEMAGSADSKLVAAIKAADRIVDHDNWEDVQAFHEELRAAAGLSK